jgi:hypothetical protein
MTPMGAAALAGLFIFQHADLQGNDALHDPLALSPTGNEVIHERADDREMRFQIGPIDGNDMILPLVVDPGRREAGISAELLERLAPDGVIHQCFVQQVRPVPNEILDLILAWFTVFAPSADHVSRPLVRMNIDKQMHEAGQEAVQVY